MSFFKRLFQPDATSDRPKSEPPVLVAPVTPPVQVVGNGLLNENEVILAVSGWLRANGYEVRSSLNTNERGVDIVARSLGEEIYDLYIEAKGATSSKDYTSRSGKGFTDSQQLDHISKAIYACMKAYSASAEAGGDRREVGIALPVTEFHRRHIGRVRPALRKLGIRVYWVGTSGDVSVEK